jgi:hypothetical protein
LSRSLMPKRKPNRNRTRSQRPRYHRSSSKKSIHFTSN